jgi:hypothetical protein
MLQPVQLVSMAAVPGEMEKVRLDELPATVPPQPASAKSAGSAAIASARAGQCRNEWDFDSGLSERVFVRRLSGRCDCF